MIMSSNFNTIKPVDQLNKVLADLGSLFDEFEGKKPQKIEIECPFCGHGQSTASFAYKSCTYRTCDQCQSLYLSPRITQQWLGQYYAFMQERFCFDIPQSQRQARINTIMKPRWDLLKKKLEPYIKSFPVKRCMEVGAGVGYFTEVAQQNNCAQEYLLVEPDRNCHQHLKGLKGNTVLLGCLLEECKEEEHGNVDLIFINSVIEHPFSLNAFFKKLHSLLSEDGIIVLVDMHSEGLDIEVLRQHAPNIYPHSILQIGSIKGIETICLNHGLLVKEVCSIGTMDVDILFEHAKQLPQDHPLKGFEKILHKKEVRSDLQEVLAKHLLTGYNAYLIQKGK